MKTKAKWRRLLSAALALVMVVGMFPAAGLTAFAATGTGTESDPIVVTTWDELKTEVRNVQDSHAEYTYIKLGADIVKDDETDQYFQGIGLGMAFKGTIVLDLNGHLLKLKNDKNESVGVITVRGGNLTVTDTSAAKTGQIVSDQPKAANAAIRVVGGNLTVDGGTFSNLCAQTYAIIEDSGSLTINGGTFESENSYNICIYSDGGSLTVNGGTICGNLYIDNTGGDREISINRCTFENGTVDHRGKFWPMFPENVVIRYGSGTTMKNLQYGSTAVNNSNFWTGVTKVEVYSDNFEADVTVTTWDDLWTEMQNAPTDRPYCIKLGKNLNYSGTDNSKVLGLSHDYQNVILDLNGYYISMNSSLNPDCAIHLNKGTLTIKDSSAAQTGKVMYSRVNTSGVVIRTSGTTGLLIINGGTYETNSGETILLQGSNTIINGGTFYGGSVRLIEHVMAGAKLTVNGGVFLSRGHSPEYTISGHDLVLINFDSVTLNGGTFYGNIVGSSTFTKEDLDECLGDGMIMVNINAGALTYEPSIDGGKRIYASMIKIVPVDEQEMTGSGTKADPYVVYTFDQLRNTVMLTDPTMYIKLGTNIKYESDTADRFLPANSGNTVVLDLNGNYLLCRNNDDGGAKRFMMQVALGTDITITDSVGTGGIAFHGQSAQTGVSSLSVDAMFYVAGDNSKLTLDHVLCGSYYQNIALAEIGGRVVLKGGKLATLRAVTLYIRNYGSAEFYDGAFVYTGPAGGIPLEVEKRSSVYIDDATFRGAYSEAKDEDGNKKALVNISQSSNSIINNMTVESPDYTGQRLFRPGGNTTIKSGAVVKLNGSIVSADQDLFEGKTLEIYSSRKITDVALTGVTEPWEDAVPDCTIDPVPDDAPYTVAENGVWWNDVEADQYPMTDSTFIYHVYCISVKLVAKDGYVFPTKSADYNTFTIDGRRAKILNADSKGKWIEVTSDTYIPIKNDVIPSVNITVGDFYDYQSSGPEIDYNDKGTGAARFYLYSSNYWRDWTGKAVSESYLSKAGWTYDGDLVFKPYSGRRFTSDTVVTVDGDVTVTGVWIMDDGKTLSVKVSAVAKAHTCTPAEEWQTNAAYHWKVCSICGKEISGSREEHPYPAPEGTEGQTVTVTCPDCGYETSMKVPGSGITEFYTNVIQNIALGKTLTENYVYVKSYYTNCVELVSTEWKSISDGTVLQVGDTFTDTSGYTLTAVFNAKDGYYFDEYYILRTDIFSSGTDRQTRTLSNTNKTLTVVDTFTGSDIGKGLDLKVSLPTLEPGTDFNDYDYSKIFAYYYCGALEQTPGLQAYGTWTYNDVTYFNPEGAFIWVDSDGNGSRTSSGTIPETGETILHWDGTKWVDLNPNDNFDTTIKKGVEYHIKFYSAAEIGYSDRWLSRGFDTTGNALDIGELYNTSRPQVDCVYYFANDDVIEYVNLTVDAPKSNGTPDTTASAPSGAGYSGGTPVWTKDGVAVTGNFTEGAYTVTIPLILDDGKSLAEDCIFAINGMLATYADGKLSLTFPAIGSIGVTVSGAVTSFNSDTDEIILQFIREGMSEAEYEVTVYGNNTTYSLTGVLPGTYTVKVMKKNHVTREYTVTVGSENVTQDVKIHLLGDINGDGNVTTIDFVRANSHARGVTILTDYALQCADVVGTDGKVTTADAVRINAHAKGTSMLW